MMHAEVELRSQWPDAISERQSAAEELANSVTHGLGLVLSLFGAALLVPLASETPGAIGLGCLVYVATLVAVYGASFLSHAVQVPLWRQRFRMLDQGFIYLLIAGTYTPYALAYLGPEWTLLSAAMWGIALLGFASKVFARHRIDSVSLGLYLVLGWLPVVATRPLLERLPVAGLWWIAAGGVAYTLGTVFLQLDGRYRYFHAVWHVLVIAGSACHFAGVFWYVLPSAVA
jgi:hemolysin III